MNKLKSIIAIFLSILTFLQSCAAYEGNYTLKTAVDNGKKVRVKTQYNEFLLYNGSRFKYNRINDNDAWNIIRNEDSITKLSVMSDSTSDILHKIILIDGNYFGFNDFENRNSWVKINHSAIIEVSKTKKEYFKRLLYQQGNYWGVDDYVVTDDKADMNLIPIYENQVKKVSQYDPVMSVLGSIIVTPLVIGLIILSAAAEDDW